MYTNPSYARYRIREKHRRLYVLTKTQMVFGFVVSVVLSIFFGAYFDKYGHLLVTQLKKTAMNAVKDAPAATAGAADDDPAYAARGTLPADKVAGNGARSSEASTANLTIEERLKLIERRSQLAGVGNSGGSEGAAANRPGTASRPR